MDKREWCIVVLFDAVCGVFTSYVHARVLVK